ncbi:MAG: hypothetical protein AB8B72_06425 [Crocinitomicaceae bacterium]
MKNIKYGALFLALVGIGFASCEKDDTAKEIEKGNERQTEVKELLVEAKSFSKEHDDHVLRVLNKIEEANLPSITEENFSDYCNVIEEELDVKLDISSQMDSEFLKVDFADEEIKLADYIEDKKAKEYLNKIDNLLFNSDGNIAKLIDEINALEIKLVAEKSIDLNTMRSTLNGIETLKGSLVLWTNYYNNGDMTKSACQNWGKIKKALFVAAADALGALIGSFGVTFVVNGTAIVIPPGFVGSAIGAGAVSVLAAMFVYLC